MRSGRSRTTLAVAIVVAPLLAGCGLLFPGMGFGSSLGIPVPGMTPTPFPRATVRSIFTTGSATLTVEQDDGSQVIVLDRVSGLSSRRPDEGTTVSWRNADDSWMLQVTVFDRTQIPAGSMGYAVADQLMMERAIPGEIWVVNPPIGSGEGSCTLTLSARSKTAIQGTATCSDLRWPYVPSMPGHAGRTEPPFVTGQAPFERRGDVRRSPLKRAGVEQSSTRTAASTRALYSHSARSRAEQSPWAPGASDRPAAASAKPARLDHGFYGVPRTRSSRRATTGQRVPYGVPFRFTGAPRPNKQGLREPRGLGGELGYTSGSRSRSDMITKIQKWGNSQGVRLSRELLSEADVEVGDAVEVAVRDGTLVVTPVRRIRGGLDLGKLVAEMPSDYEAEGIEWGPPVGSEVW